MKEVWKTHGVIMYWILRLNKKLFIFILLLSSCFVKTGMAGNAKKTKEAESVKFVFAEEDKATKVFLYPGRVSLLSLPCPITKALVGSPKDIKVELDSLNTKELHILLKKWHSQVSNLILKCEDKVFLFSLIPSKIKHYDYLKVLGHVSSNPFLIKSIISKDSLSFDFRDLKERDFKIKKVLDHSWRLKK